VTPASLAASPLTFKIRRKKTSHTNWSESASITINLITCEPDLTDLTVYTGGNLSVSMVKTTYFTDLASYKTSCTGDYRMTFENLVGVDPDGGTYTELSKVGNFVT
jgi:hypothetical protein